MELVTMLGLVAGCCTTAAYIPQVMKAWRTRSTKDVSLGMYVLMITGCGLWIAYAVLRLDGPVIAANVITLSLIGAVLILKLRHG